MSAHHILPLPLLLLALSSCEPPAPQQRAQARANFTTVTYAGCEYLAWEDARCGIWNYTHKGNCTNHWWVRSAVATWDEQAKLWIIHPAVQPEAQP